MSYDNKRLSFGISSDGSNSIIANTPTNSIGPEIWYYQVGTYTGTQVRIYRDGNFAGSDPHSGGIFNSSATFKIGIRTTTSQKFEGIVDEVRVSAISRTPDWIRAQYRSMTNQFVSFSASETQ